MPFLGVKVTPPFLTQHLPQVDGTNPEEEEQRQEEGQEQETANGEMVESKRDTVVESSEVVRRPADPVQQLVAITASAEVDCRAALTKYKGNIDRAANALVDGFKAPKQAALKNPSTKKKREAPIKEAFTRSKEQSTRMPTRRNVSKVMVVTDNDLYDDPVSTPSPKKVKSVAPTPELNAAENPESNKPSKSVSRTPIEASVSQSVSKGTPMELKAQQDPKPIIQQPVPELVVQIKSVSEGAEYYKYKKDTDKLTEMGFPFEEANLTLIKKKGNLKKALEALMKKAANTSTGSVKKASTPKKRKQSEISSVDLEPAMENSQPEKVLRRLRRRSDVTPEKIPEKEMECVVDEANDKALVHNDEDLEEKGDSEDTDVCDIESSKLTRSRQSKREVARNTTAKKPAVEKAIEKKKVAKKSVAKKPEVTPARAANSLPAANESPCNKEISLVTPRISRRKTATGTKSSPSESKATLVTPALKAGDLSGTSVKKTTKKTARNTISPEKMETEGRNIHGKKKKAVADETRPRGLGSKNSKVFVSSDKAGLSDVVKAVVKKLGKGEYVYEASSTASMSPHDVLVTGDSRRTLKVLRALAVGCWIVTPEWASNSLDREEWQNLEDYERKDAFPGARLARMAAKREGSQFLSHYQFYVQGESLAPQPKDLKELIKAAGGHIANTLSRASHCILGHEANVKHDNKISPTWLFDSLEQHREQNIDDYRICEDNDLEEQVY